MCMLFHNGNQTILLKYTGINYSYDGMVSWWLNDKQSYG